MDIGLTCDQSSDTCSSVVDYVDSDYIGDLDKRKSLTGYVFTLSDCAIN